MIAPLHAPFPYFGGKSRIARLVWSRFGDAPNYVEPFAGSLAVLLARPTAPGYETVNDKCGFVTNFWRAVSSAPEEVAHYADWPVLENDLHARHIWLRAQEAGLVERLEGDPDYCDAKIAGWWVWGASCWIARGWCSGGGPWQSVDGRMTRVGSTEDEPHPRGSMGVLRALPHLHHSRGVHRRRRVLAEWFDALSERLGPVRVVCGDWSRVCGPTPTYNCAAPTAVFLDPPYAADLRASGCYRHDELGLSDDVRRWAIERGDDARMRIALCGYEGEHHMPSDWDCVSWSPNGGYGSQSYDGRGRQNKEKERIWFSPHCVSAQESQLELFDGDGFDNGFDNGGFDDEEET